MNAQPHLSGSAARVFDALIRLAAGRTTVCADYSIISQVAGAARATVARAIRELSAAGRIAVDKRQKRKTDGCYCYQLNYQHSDSSIVQLSPSDSSIVQSDSSIVQRLIVQSHELSERKSSSLSHEMNDEMNDDERVRLIFSQLAEAGIKGPNAQWLAKEMAPKAEAPETIKRISSEVDSQKGWRKPLAVKYRKLEAYALGLQDPLPYFEGEIGAIEKPKGDVPSAPKQGQRQARTGGKSKTHSLPQVNYTDDERYAARMRAIISLAEMYIRRGESTLEAEIVKMREQLKKTDSDILRDWIARKTKTEVTR